MTKTAEKPYLLGPLIAHVIREYPPPLPRTGAKFRFFLYKINGEFNFLLHISLSISFIFGRGFEVQKYIFWKKIIVSHETFTRHICLGVW